MKHDLDEMIKINNLLSFYGNLLTNQQKEIMKSYYVFNLSLAEISSEKNISRTAVSDAIKVSIKKLNEYEDALKLCKTFEEEKKNNVKNIKIIEQLEEKLKNGI